MADMSAKGRGSAGDRKGRNNPRAKLADNDVLIIREMLNAGLTQRVIAARFGVTQTIIYKIGKREIWAHIA
jgi:hypothetical protein